jgi:hypothetical protein
MLNKSAEFNITHNNTSFKVRLTYINSVVTNIEVKLTREQRRQILCKLADDKINFKNSAYTYVLQGFIAKYMGESEHEMRALERESRAKKKRLFNIFNKNHNIKLEKIEKTRKWGTYLHKLSTHYIALESFVNNASGDPVEKLNDFENKFTTFKYSILKDLDDYIKTLSDDEPRKKTLIKLRQNISDNADSFAKQFEKLRLNNNKQDLDCLLSIADRALFIKSLGTFMREQMSFILDAGIKVSYQISHNRLRDVIQVPRFVAYLSDAEHLLLIKGQSIVEGPKENDTYAPIPKEMLEALTGAEEIQGNEELYFSLSPYLKKMHPKYLDDILCLITKKSRDDNSYHGNYFYHFILQPLKLIASVFEIAFSIPRLLLVIGLGVVEAIFSPFSSKPNEAKITWKINQFISGVYDYLAFVLAPLTYLNNIERSKYKRIGENLDDHQKILDDCADYSSYCHKLFRYFNPLLISVSIKEFFISMLTSITNFLADLRYLLTPDSNKQEVYLKIRERQAALKLLHETFGVLNSNIPQKSKDSYDNVVYCDSNNVVSPLDVFYEIAVVLSNDVVNPMFRKSPGLATFYFALSMLTFGTLVLPASAFAWMKPVPGWLQYLANQISLHFTGKSTSAGLMEQSIACFLGWKLGFFSTEFVVEMADGHYEILEKLFEEPEQIVLGLVGLVGIGMGLQYIPELPSTIKIPGLPDVPNPYFIIINTFTEEAKSCAEGTIGLTAIEYGFLGLKFAMLMHSMLSNSEREESKLTDLEKMVLVLQQNNFFQEFLRFCKDKKLEVKNLQANALDIKKFIQDKLKDIGENFHEENLEKFTELLVSPNQGLALEAKTKSQPQTKTLAEARDNLLQAIALITDKDNKLLLSRSVFGVNKEAHQLYDKLDSLFEEYNAALKREKPLDYAHCSIDKSQFLDVFFNKYIYKRSNNFVRSILLILYPIPLISRSLKYLWATITHKPSMQHQIVKNFSKDFVILSQIFTPVARMVADFNLYLSGVLRAVAFLTITPLAGLIVYPVVEGVKYARNPESYKRVPFSKWFEVIDEYLCRYIALHKTPALQPIRQLIVRAARVAGVNTNLDAAADKVMRELKLTDKSENNLGSYASTIIACSNGSNSNLVANSAEKEHHQLRNSVASPGDDGPESFMTYENPLSLR